MTDKKPTPESPRVIEVNKGDAFYAPPGTVVKHLDDDAQESEEITSGNIQDRSEFEKLFSRLHPATNRTLFERVIDDSRYCSMETEYACRTWILTTSARKKDKQIELAKERMRTAIPYFRGAIADAKKNGVVKLGILAENPDGSGKLEMKFECEDFFSDLALVAEAKPQTKEDDAAVSARKFLSLHGLLKD